MIMRVTLSLSFSLRRCGIWVCGLLSVFYTIAGFGARERGMAWYGMALYVRCVVLLCGFFGQSEREERERERGFFFFRVGCGVGLIRVSQSNLSNGNISCASLLLYTHH